MQIPLSCPDITDLERQAVQEVLLTPHLALGPKLQEFEQKIAAYHNRKYAVAVSSGTSALHLAMLALDLRPGEEVITTPFSFIASSNCALYVGGVPRFVDIHPATWNLDPDALASALTPRTRGILPVHVFGVPCEMDRINDFARQHGLWVVEDACEAIGARDGGGLVGRAADISVLAFYPNKQMTTGEGGVLLTDDPDVHRLCRSLRNQGRDEFAHNGSCHQRLGYNYRLSDISAALGIAQLSRLDEILAKRALVAARYLKRLQRCDWLQSQQPMPDTCKSWFVFIVVLSPAFQTADRDLVLRELRARGIGCSNYFAPIHLQPFMRSRFGYQAGAFPVCEYVAERTLALPFHANLSLREIDFVCDSLLEIGEGILSQRSEALVQRAAS